MTRPDKVLTYLAFSLMALFGVLGTLLVAGEALAEPGGRTGVLLTALWVLPAAAVSLLAWRRPEPAARVLTLVTWAAVALTLVDAPETWGPVTTVVVFAVGVALGFLGLRRPGRAGLLMLVLAVTLLLATVGSVVLHELGLLPPGPGLGASAGVVALPLLVVGTLFRLTHRLAQRVSESEPVAERPASSRATGTRNGEQET
jgi:hypothetical protein